MSDVFAVPEHYSPARLTPSVLMDGRAPARESRFEMLAELSQRLPPHCGRDLDVLLAASCAGMTAGPAVLQPVWAEEAMHRAFAMMRLLGRRRYPAPLGVEQNLARDLAALFRLLDASAANEPLPCSRLLRDVTADLVGLFASSAGTEDVTLRTSIQPLRLPAYKRRALILAAAELVMNALSHAFSGRACGRIEVTLCSLSAGRSRLRVKDDGVGFLVGQPNLHCGVAVGLAGLLEADLCYSRTGSLTVAEIVFPVGES